MSDANVLEFSEIIDALLEGSPAGQKAAAIDLTWIVEHDEESRSLKHWAVECLKIGAATKKRGMEAVVATRNAKKQAKETGENLAKFANVLAMNPTIMQHAKDGDISLLLQTAGSFKIPTDVVLGFLAQVQPKNASESKTAAA